jgi:hypothetical protein
VWSSYYNQQIDTDFSAYSYLRLCVSQVLLSAIIKTASELDGQKIISSKKR